MIFMAQPLHPIIKMTHASVLFVCTANLCRSPTAEVMFASIVTRFPLNQFKWQISSAGTWTKPGLPAADYAQKAVQKYGLSLKSHYSRSVNDSLLLDYGLILTMESGHKEALQFEFPKTASKVYLLSEMVGLVEEVIDPAGHSLTEYEKVAEKIFNWLEKGKLKILDLALEN